MAEAIRPKSLQSKAKTKSKVKVKKVMEDEEKEKIKKELSKSHIESLTNYLKPSDTSQIDHKATKLAYENIHGLDIKTSKPVSNQSVENSLVAIDDGADTGAVHVDVSEQKTLECVPLTVTQIPYETFSDKEIIVEDQDTLNVEPVELSGFVTAPQTPEALSEVALSGEITSKSESNYQEIHYNPFTLAENSVLRIPEEAAVHNTGEKSIYPDLSHHCEEDLTAKENVLSTVTENVELIVTGLESNTAESFVTDSDVSATDSSVQAVEYSVNTVVTKDTIVITGEITNEASGILVTDEPIVSGITKTSYKTVTSVEDNDIVAPLSTVSDSANIALEPNLAQMTENQNIVVVSSEQLSAAIKQQQDQNITSLSERYDEVVSSHVETDAALLKPVDSLVRELAHSSIDSDDLTGQYEVISRPKIESESENIFTDPQHVSLEDVPSEDYTSFLPDERCMFPQSSVQSKPVSEQTHRVHIVKEAICDRFKPMTFEQLQLLYYNPQLVQSTAFIDQFIISEGKKENHEFHEILWNYFRARKNLLNAEEEIKLLQQKYCLLHEEMWIITPQSITAQGQCGDKAKVSKAHVYEKCELNTDSLNKMKEILDTTRDNIVNKISLYAYSSQLSRLQVESYIYTLYQSCPVIRDIPKNTPLQANLKQRPEYLHQVNRLKDCISVLFGFHRKPCRDEEFKQNIRKWTEIMIGSLLRLATFEDHCFILNHILRCPGGVGQWASKLIQIPPPVTSVGGIFGSPLLDHVVVCLATVLLHPRARDEFMCQMKLSVNSDSLNQDATWILVDSDGEEDEDPANAWLYLHENDIVAILQQFPISSVYSHILMVRTDSFGTVQYSIHETNESVILKIFAFTTCWIDLLGRGLQTYCMSRYRQLNKRIGKMIRETVALISDHWYNYKTLILQPALSINRLQGEFDQFFMRATYCILAAERLGSWQFMTNMPFTCVSSDCMWQLLWILHQGQGQELDLDCIPSVEECKTYLKDGDSRNQLIDNLVNLQSSETIYLLSTFANMAESRPTTEVDFIQAITLEVFEISYICDHTREFCSKVGRELLAVIIDKHPYTFSVILHAVQSNIKQIGTMSIFLFRELPLYNCVPTDPDLLILRQWLLNCDLHTHENQLSRLILSYFNWDIHPQNGPILPIRLHKQIALLLVEVYRKYISSRNSSWLIGEGIRQVASAVRQNVTAEQKFNNWAWDLALRLKLHVNSMSLTGVISDLTPCNLDIEDWLLPIVKGIKHKNPIACYLGLLMSTRTHNVTEFVGEGLDILASLVSANQFTAVIHVLSCVCPYFLSTPAYIVDNDRFIKILQSTLWADETLYKMAKSVIVSDFPGGVSKQFVNMIQNDVNNKRELYQCNLIILFWVHAVTKINKWYNDRNCCYVLDKIIEIGFTLDGLLPQIQDIITACFQKFLKESNQQGMVSSVVSWISSGVYIYQPSLLEKHTEFIYLAYLVLLVEKKYEIRSLIWPALQEELYNNQLSTVDQALRTAIAKLKLQQAPAINRLNIYRWAQHAIDTPYDHTLLPLIWQQFFLLYLGRNASERSVPQRASVGERFFSSLSYTPLLKKMRKRLSDCIELLKKDIEDSTTPPIDSVDNQPPHKIFTPQQIEIKLMLSKLYSTMVLWLEEPRLHDTNLYLPSLPPQYDSSRLLLLFQNIQDPWLEFVDIHEVYNDIIIQGHEWKKYVFCKQQRSTTFSQQPQNATERILKYLRKEDGIKPAPSLVNLHPTVPDIDITILQDKSALLHLVNADISIVKQHASLFSSRISRHCGADLSYIDLLPSLFSNQWKQVLIPIECKSKVNPLHRCSNPAVVQVRIEEREKNELIQRQVDENRAEYKQMMIEGLLPPPQNVCISAVHVENAITMLIKLTQATTTETQVSHLFDIANTLFYHLATVITQETDFYPPTKQFFTSCIEILGQEFISRDPKQTKQLLQFCLDNSNLSNLTCQHFQPNNSLDIFVPLYERLIHVLQQQNLDLVFMLLTKFDVKMWLEKGKPARENVKSFLSVLGSALMSCGAEPEKQSKIIFDLYCGHLQLVLRADYPVYLIDVLNILLQGSSIERVHVDCWEMFLMICFTYNTKQTVEEDHYKFDLNAIQQCRDIQLSTAEVSEILNCLSRYFTGARKGTTTERCLYGLYPAWGRYVPYIAQLLSGFSRALVTKMLFNLSDIDPYQVLDVIWQQTIGVFSPWTEPIWSNNQLISPWHEGDDLVAREMVFAFKNIVQFIYNEYAEKAPAYSSSVYSLLLMYFMRSLAKPGLVAHVASTFTAELLDLNWNLLKPDLQLLETMTTVKDSSCEDCFYLIGSVLRCVEWNDIWDYHINHQPPDMTCRFQSTLLLLLIQIYTSPSLLQDEEKVRLLVNMEKREWNFITLSSYRQASNVFLMSAEPVSVLAERSSSAARGLGLMKSAGCFCNDTDNMWSGDRQAKRQMFIHTVISLLCQCTYLPDINQETFSTVLVNLLTDLEQVEQSASDWTNQQVECVELLKTIISLLNNCNPEGNWKDIIITTMNQWIYSSPNSVLLIPCLKAASRNIASYNLMVTVMENCIDVIFHPESEFKDWTPVLTSFQPPDNNINRFLDEAINNGAYLVLQTYLLQQIPFCQSLVDEFKLMELTVEWTEKAKPGSDNESKLLLWWWKLVTLMIYYIDRKGSIQNCIQLLYRLIAALQILGEDRTSTGLLGAIGFGRKSQLSLRFRVTARVMAAFLASQILSVTEVRLTARPDLSVTSIAKQTMTAFQTMKTNKQYSEYKDQCDILCVFIQDEMICFRQAQTVISQLIQAFYPDKLYLNVILNNQT